MKIISTKAQLILLASMLLFISCQNSTNKKSTKDKSVAEKIMNQQDIKPDIKEALYQFPTPLEVTVMLNEARAAFIFNITNPVDNLDKYMEEQLKALFLGVYSADLSYAAAYNRSDEIEKLMDCTITLSDELGISGIYNENLVEIVKENYNNKDSLVSLLSTVFDETKRFLSKNNRNQVSVLMVSGGFIETVYLASNLNALSDDNKEITAIIYEQNDNIMKLINILSVYNEHELITSIKNDLKNLKEFIDKNEIDENGAITKEKSEELKVLVDQIRNKLSK